MYKYAHIANGKVQGILNSGKLVEDENLVQITENVEIGSIYDSITGEFSAPEIEENSTEPSMSIEERLESIEDTVAYNQLQTEYLVILAEFSAM